ncbi:MAG: DUF1214 domain-containing protein [Pseudomonadales bacterium]
MTESEQRIIDGTAWDEFCDSLKAAGQLIQRPDGPTDAFNRAEGYRYLTRLLRGACESFVEFSDPSFPTLRCPCHETIKMGADNPDNYYMSCPLNPALEYKLVGQRGTVDYLGFGSVANRYATGGGMQTAAYLDAQDMEFAEDGSFEVIISSREHPGNWLEMDADTNQLNVRQTFQDRINEVRAEVKIERLDQVAGPKILTAEKMDKALGQVAQFMHGTGGLFAGWAESFIPITNEIPPADQGFCQAIGGDPNIYYFHSAWQLADDECLLIEAPTVPECQTWNFQLDNWWMESLDYRYHTVHINKHTAHYESDGSVKLVIAHTDPGHPNWVETTGHNDGTMCWRWIRADENPPLKIRVLKLADLPAAL